MPRTSRRRERQRLGPRGRPHSGPRSGSGTPLPTRVPSPERVPLPDDPALTPPLPAAFERALDVGLSALALELGPGLRAAIASQVRLLLAWNEQINLTAVRDPAAVALEHIVDSLTALPLLAERVPRPLTLLDIGSGAGYPGLPLGLVLRAERIVLVESVKKKAAFLGVAGAAAVSAFLMTPGETAPEIRVVADRAEALGRDPAYRGRIGLVTARAVAPLSRLIPLAVPFLTRGGLAVAWKSDDGTGSLGRELDAAAGALDAAGLDRGSVVVAEVEVDGLRDHRLVLIPAPPGPGRRAPD